jgi:hypothetical protein
LGRSISVYDFAARLCEICQAKVVVEEGERKQQKKKPILGLGKFAISSSRTTGTDELNF